MQGECYKYVVYPGNNPTVIRDSLQKRGVWRAVESDRLLSANFIWKPLNFTPANYLQIDEQVRENGHRVLMNHFQQHGLITTKTGLVKSLRNYYTHQPHLNSNVFDTIPTTFVLRPHQATLQEQSFKERHAQLQMKLHSRQKMPLKHCQHNIWFIKPISSNQGRGITLLNSYKEIEEFIQSRPHGSEWIVQKAVQKPLLYEGRKFDIRVWVLVTPSFDIYYYNKPYMRTTSTPYDIKDLRIDIHLTNNFQQKHLQDYSKYEKGNTLPLDHLLTVLSDKVLKDIVQRMQELVLDCLYSVKKVLLKNRKKEFQLLGFDFLVDEDYRTWLLEVNNNPYLGAPNPFIADLLPQMVDEMMEIVVDPVFPPTTYTPVATKRFQLLHRETVQSRVSQRRSMSIEQSKRVYYPPHAQVHDVEGYTIPQKLPVLRQITPVDSVRQLLDTYLFMDYDPFLTPVSLILSSPKLKESDCLPHNAKTLKLITQGRLMGILFQSRILQQSKVFLSDGKIPLPLKAILLRGLTEAIKTNRHRQIITEQILPLLMPVNECLAAQIIALLIKLGAMVNRCIFVPGETRELQLARAQFIKSNCFTLLKLLAQKYPQSTEEYDRFINNISAKDEELQNGQRECTLDNCVIAQWESEFKSGALTQREQKTKDFNSKEQRNIFKEKNIRQFKNTDTMYVDSITKKQGSIPLRQQKNSTEKKRRGSMREMAESFNIKQFYQKK